MTMPTRAELPLQIAAAVARVFGLLTIFAGGMALFGGKAAQDAAGAVVPFVLWFNFGAGFAYVAAGFGLAWRRRWGLWLSLGIFAATALVGLAFGVHVLQGGAYEMRTVGALAARTAVWAAIAVVALRARW
ncbi:MAG: hypothetical protein Q8P60_07160 [Pseudorhodobacter sp.]|nr:hypothetical protein [Pseudorhodobacter sp.]